MKLRFLPHAVIRMQERKVSVVEIEEIITSPDGSIQQSRDKIIHYKKLRGRKDNKVAAVVVEHFPGDIVEVITVLVNFEVKK